MNGTRSRPVPLSPAWPALSLLATLLLAGCGGGKTIQIGLVSTFSDPVGKGMRLGAQLAVEEINNAGGIDGRMIELLEWDDYNQPDSAVAAANRMVRSKAVATISGAFSGPTLASAPVYNDERNPLVQISPAASSPLYSTAGDWSFRVCPSDLAHAAALARYVRQDLRLSRGAVLYLNNNYGRGFRDAFEQEFIRLGGSLISSDPYLPDRPRDASAYLDRLAQAGDAQFILAASYRTDGLEVLRMARAKGITAAFLGGDGIEGIELDGAIAEGTYQSAAYLWNVETESNRAFLEKYRTRFSGEAPPNQTAAGTYDAIHLLARLIGEVGTDRRALRNALAEVGRSRPAYDGVGGRISFDSLGDVPDKPVVIAQARGGVARPLEVGQ